MGLTRRDLIAPRLPDRSEVVGVDCQPLKGRGLRLQLDFEDGQRVWWSLDEAESWRLFDKLRAVLGV